MRSFLRDHWKALVAIALLVVLALATVNPGSATPALTLAQRLRAHVAAVAASEHEQAARYIESTLQSEGYVVHRQAHGAGVQVSIANVAPHAKPERIFIVGANDKAGGTAAVLELARLLKTMRPSRGTEVQFVFFVDDTGRPDGGNFIAFVGTRASSRPVQRALAAFQATQFPARGLAAPDYVEGVTLSDHAAYRRFGYPTLMITDTAFLRYPYYHTLDDTPDRIDAEGVARVVQGLARTIAALAGEQQG